MEVASGEWRVASGEWRVASLTTNHSPLVTNDERRVTSDELLEIRAKLSDEPNYGDVLKQPYEKVKWEMSCLYLDGREIKLGRGSESFETAGWNSTTVRELDPIKWNISYLDDGEYTLRLELEDMLGNKSLTEQKFNKAGMSEGLNVHLDSTGFVQGWLKLRGNVEGSSWGKYRVEYRKGGGAALDSRLRGNDGAASGEANWNKLIDGWYRDGENVFLRMNTKGSNSWPLMSRIEGIDGRFLVKDGKVIGRDRRDGIIKVYDIQGNFLFGFGEDKDRCEPWETGEGDVGGYGLSFGPEGIYAVSSVFNAIQVFKEVASGEWRVASGE